MQEMTDKLTKSTNSLYNNHKRNTLKTLIPTSLRTTIENENNHASGSHHHPDAPLANSSHSNTPPHHHSELFHDVLKDVEKLEVENLCGMFGQAIKLSSLFPFSSPLFFLG